jgi:hypothetical protein
MPNKSYPISGEWLAAGLRWRDDFFTQALSEANGFAFTGAPTFLNGLVLNGTTQYGTATLNPGIVDLDSLFFYIEFTPTIAFPPGAIATIIDTQAASRLACFIAADGTLTIVAGATTVAQIPLGNYSGVLNATGKNVLVVSMTSGDNLIWLNGTKLTNSLGDAVAWSNSGGHRQLIVGTDHTATDFFAGTIHRILFGSTVLTLRDGNLLSVVDGEEIIVRRFFPENSVFTLPFKSQYVDGGGLTVTDALGQISGAAQQPMLGSTGLDAANFPTLLTPRGYQFDGVNDRITIPDNPLLSFGDGLGNDSPFTICGLFRLRTNAGGWVPFAKGFGVGSQLEWRLQGSGTTWLYLFIYDAAANYIARALQILTNFDFIGGAVFSIIASYDGSSSNTGINFYINGDFVSTIPLSSGVYGGMTPLGDDFAVGYNLSSSFVNGDIFFSQLFRAEFVPLQCSMWDYRAKRLMTSRV